MKEPKRERLNRVSYTIRRAQLLTYGGVGAMVDFQDQTLMTATPESWAATEKIHDERFEKILDVDFFGAPTVEEGITYSRFPEWYFCPKCRRFQPLNKWKREFELSQRKKFDKDRYMVKNIRCSECKINLVPASIVMACEKGHIDDFPWVKWVHANSKERDNVCNDPRLLFKVGTSAAQGLEGMHIQCVNCGAKTSLKGSFNIDTFSKLDKLTEYKFDFTCTGKHPWKNTKEYCEEYPKTMQRGATSVYFPYVMSSLVIPPYSSELTVKIENTQEFNDFITSVNTIKKYQPDETVQKGSILQEIKDKSKLIGLKIGENTEQIEKTLERKIFDNNDDIDFSQYKIEEYEALNGEFSIESNGSGDFVREELPIDEYGIPGVEKVALIHKVREVQALIGFSRIKPVKDIDDDGFVSIKEPDMNWYPAHEVRGEGIFIQFNSGDIEKWLDNNILNERLSILELNNKNSWASKQKSISSKLLFLHTMSHLLIKQLSFECGYNIASLKERLYCMDEAEGKDMSGIFIYTADGDSEGSLGGLVRQGRPDVFPKVFRKAIESAVACSNDPVCNLSLGQGRDSLNLAACYSCALIPETSCELFNSFLDRGCIIGTFEHPEIGFYSEYILGEK